MKFSMQLVLCRAGGLVLPQVGHLPIICADIEVLDEINMRKVDAEGPSALIAGLVPACTTSAYT